MSFAVHKTFGGLCISVGIGFNSANKKPIPVVLCDISSQQAVAPLLLTSSADHFSRKGAKLLCGTAVDSDRSESRSQCELLPIDGHYSIQ